MGLDGRNWNLWHGKDMGIPKWALYGFKMGSVGKRNMGRLWAYPGGLHMGFRWAGHEQTSI